MPGFGEAHDVYVVFGHVVVDFVTFSLGVDALYVEGTDAVRGFVFDSLFNGRFGFLSLRRGLFLLSTMCPAGFASAGGAVRFSSCYAFVGSESSGCVACPRVVFGRMLAPSRRVGSLVSAGYTYPRLTRHAVHWAHGGHQC